MKKIIVGALGVAAVTAGTIIALSQGADLDLNGLEPGDKAFHQPVLSAVDNELNIVSFNLRDIRGTERTLEDFQELARLIDGADIIVFQEMGAKGFGTRGDNEGMMDRLRASTAVLTTYLGNEWNFVFADNPTPETLGPAAEIPCIGYRTTRGQLTITASWEGYYDLGSARDMGLFEVVCSNGTAQEEFTIGTVHTKPDCPERGKELLKVANYVDSHENENYILLGDFNWGYYSTKSSTCINKYEGEERITQQHEEGKVFQVFHSISYTGKGKDDDFRTNLNVRSTGQMYDQFLICKSFADRLSHGGSLGEDCGFVSFSDNKYFEDRIDDIVREQLKGVKAYMRSKGYNSKDTETKTALKEAEAEIRKTWFVEDEASYKMSDHKPIWVQIDIF